MLVPSIPLSVCPSVRIDQQGTKLTGCNEVLYFNFYENLATKSSLVKIAEFSRILRENVSTLYRCRRQ